MNQHPTRRDLLKGTAAASVGAATLAVSQLVDFFSERPAIPMVSRVENSPDRTWLKTLPQPGETFSQVLARHVEALRVAEQHYA